MPPHTSTPSTSSGTRLGTRYVHHEGPSRFDEVEPRPLDKEIQGKSAAISAAFSPSGQELLVGYDDASVVLHPLENTRRTILRFTEHKAAVTSVDFSPAGNLIASASMDGTMKLWVPTARGNHVTAKAHQGVARQVRFLPDAQRVITCGDDKSAKIWSVNQGRFISSFRDHSNWVRAVAVATHGHHDGLVATGGDDRVVKLWDSQKTQRTIATFGIHGGAVSALAFSPDGTALAAASFEGVMDIWDLRTNRLLQHHPLAHDGPISALDWHIGGRVLLSSGHDSKVNVWDVSMAESLYTCCGHKRQVMHVRFDSTCRRFATSGEDARVILWTANFEKLGTHTGALIRNQIDQSALGEIRTPRPTVAPPADVVPANFTGSHPLSTTPPHPPPTSSSSNHVPHPTGVTESKSTPLVVAPMPPGGDMAIVLQQIVQSLALHDQRMHRIEDQITHLTNRVVRVEAALVEVTSQTLRAVDTSAGHWDTVQRALNDQRAHVQREVEMVRRDLGDVLHGLEGGAGDGPPERRAVQGGQTYPLTASALRYQSGADVARSEGSSAEGERSEGERDRAEVQQHDDGEALSPGPQHSVTPHRV